MKITFCFIIFSNLILSCNSGKIIIAGNEVNSKNQIIVTKENIMQKQYKSILFIAIGASQTKYFVEDIISKRLKEGLSTYKVSCEFEYLNEEKGLNFEKYEKNLANNMYDAICFINKADKPLSTVIYAKSPIFSKSITAKNVISNKLNIIFFDKTSLPKTTCEMLMNYYIGPGEIGKSKILANELVSQFLLNKLIYL